MGILFKGLYRGLGLRAEKVIGGPSSKHLPKGNSENIFFILRAAVFESKATCGNRASCHGSRLCLAEL